MGTVSRWIGCLSLSLAAIAVTVAPSGALEVQACFSKGTGTPLVITDDPTDPVLCPPANQLSAMSAVVTIDYFGTAAVGQPLVITKGVDATSPVLFVTAAGGRFLPTVLVVFFDGTSKSRGNRILSILLSNAQIKEFSQSAQDQNRGIPIETISFIYQKLQMRDDVSGASSCWDFPSNKAC